MIQFINIQKGNINNSPKTYQICFNLNTTKLKMKNNKYHFDKNHLFYKNWQGKKKIKMQPCHYDKKKLSVYRAMKN